MIALLDELQEALLIHGDDLRGVQADGRRAGFARAHGFPAFKAGVFHHEAGLPVGVQNFHFALVMEQAHALGLIFVLRKRATHRQQRKKQRGKQNDQSFRRSSFHNKSLLSVRQRRSALAERANSRTVPDAALAPAFPLG